MKTIQILIVLSLTALMLGCKTTSQTAPPQVDPYKAGDSTNYGTPDQSTNGNISDREEEVEEHSIEPLPPTDNEEEAIGRENLNIPGELNPARDLEWYPIHFGFDQASIQEEDKLRLTDYAALLKSEPNLRVQLEGHCDNRGTTAYNLALGERRASAVKRFLIQLGVSQEQISTISYGEEKPMDLGENEAAWSKNRRVAFQF